MITNQDIQDLFQKQIMRETAKANREIARKLSQQAVARMRAFDRQFAIGGRL